MRRKCSKKNRRNWAELDQDILVTIFRLVGAIRVLKSVGAVCSAWRKAAKEPELWRRIDMTNHDYGDGAFTLMYPTRLAIDRSRGKLEEFWIEYLGDDDLLEYQNDRTSVLKSLQLISCYQISDGVVINTAKRHPLLEEIQITFGSFSEKLPELIRKELPNLKQFKLNGKWFKLSPSAELDNEIIAGREEEAFGIAKTMHQLRRLQLVGNRLGNKGLKAILEGCRHLETLDIRRCYYVNMDSDMRDRAPDSKP
ncbi:hypothetical protein LUZ60_014706 [Juncus effusus]|nr:hypothetical protein LUZ60_014706 [Juncus effusus]